MIDSMLWWTGFALWACGALYAACVVLDRMLDRIARTSRFGYRILEYWARRDDFRRWRESKKETR